MKKSLCIILLIGLMFVLGGCSNTHNTIINETVDVDYNITTLEDTVEKAIEGTVGAVVSIKVYGKDSSILLYNLYDTGSGGIYEGEAVTSDGAIYSLADSLSLDNISFYRYKIFTNAHVININKNYVKVTVILAESEEEIEASIWGYDNEFDLAVLSIETSRYITPLKWGDSTQTKAGQFVVSLGSPRGVSYASSATFGIISYAKRALSDATYNRTYLFIQHDADINPGSSGGPLINLKGEVVGINAQRITSATSGSVTTAILAMNFAIPGTLAKIILDYITDTDIYAVNLVVTGYEDIVDNQAVVKVKTSQESEIKVGDIIESINGYAINNLSDFNILSHYVFKNSIITLNRNGESQTIVI